MMEHLLKTIRGFEGVLEVAPTDGDGTPAIAWGDHFFYYSPDGTLPRRQPYATIITKNYPDDTASDLDRPGRYRLNIHVGRENVPVDVAVDHAESDVVLPHPTYARQGWVSIVDPGPRTAAVVVELLRLAHADDRRRVTRSGD